MLHEFAVEPELLGEWQRCRYIIEKFGFHRGRVISNFPKKWKSLVIEASDQSSTGEMNKSRVIELLQGCKNLLVPSGRDYQFPDNWLKSAESAHNNKPFHAILAMQNLNQHANVIAYDELTETHELFNCSVGCSMPKNANGFVEVAGRLLQLSRQVIFVDPFFWKASSNPERKTRWGAPLKALLDNISCNITMLRFCTSASPKGEAPDARQNEIVSSLPAFIPAGHSLEIVLLNNASGQDTHNRFILTERGGIIFPWGLDARHDDSPDTVNLMDPNSHNTKFNEFSDPDNQGHSVATSFVVKGTATT